VPALRLSFRFLYSTLISENRLLRRFVNYRKSRTQVFPVTGWPHECIVCLGIRPCIPTLVFANWHGYEACMPGRPCTLYCGSFMDWRWLRWGVHQHRSNSKSEIINWIVKSSRVRFNLQGAIDTKIGKLAMAQLRRTVLLIASAFLVLQLTELVAAATTNASWYTAPFYRKFLPFLSNQLLSH